MTIAKELVGFYPSARQRRTRPRSSGDRATASGAVCAGSNPAGGTQHEVPKDPVTSGNAEGGVFAFVQAYAARSGRMSGSVDYSWTGSWAIVPGQPRQTPRPPDRSRGLKRSDERQPVAAPPLDDARRGVAPSKWTTTVV